MAAISFVEWIVGEHICEGVKITFTQPRVKTMESRDFSWPEPVHHWEKAIACP
jgi:hypothetical protein